MTESDPEIDYGIRILRNPLEFKKWGMLFLKDRPQHFNIKDFSYTYVSPYRPLGSWARLGNDVGIMHVRENTASLLFTKETLSLEQIYRLELVPYFGKTRGLYIMQLANALKQPVELGYSREVSDGMMRVAVLFKNPRGKWQMSYFTEGLGPTSHDESGDKPEDLVEAAYTSGYQDFHTGLLDAMSETFQGHRP